MTQFVTLAEAKNIAKALGDIGGGILPYRADVAAEAMPPDVEEIDQASGIYIPMYNGPFATPKDGEREFYHFRFRNGADGFNAGLVKRTMEYSPTRWPLMIATEVAASKRRW
jgi:hypothetical protein